MRSDVFWGELLDASRLISFFPLNFRFSSLLVSDFFGIDLSNTQSLWIVILGLLIVPTGREYPWTNIWISINVVGVIRFSLSLSSKLWQVFSAFAWKRKAQKFLKQITREFSSDECCICHDCLIEYISLDCNHCFHLHCLLKWLRNNGTCPICRSEISNGLTKIMTKIPSEVDLYDSRGFFQVMIR